MNEADARLQVLETARTISQTGLSPGRSGNVSLRWDDGALITPSAMPYDVMTAEDIVLVDNDGVARDPNQTPSTEWRFHLAAHSARPDCNAVVHAHSLNATVLACSGKPIPAFHYMVAVAGGKVIPLVPYALFGTRELADHVANGLEECNACLLSNHGQVAIGQTLTAALDLAQEIEILATQYVNALQIGAPKVLSDAAMDEVLLQFKNYGRPGTGA